MYATLVLLLACTGTPDPEPAEGDDAGECSDDADNDRDGLFDCDDQDCAGADACAAVVDTDTDSDAETNADTDPDTDTQGPDPWSDDDRDGLSEMAGDCDDANAEVSPRAIERWNGVDDDCNGHIDDEILDEAFDGVIVWSGSNVDDTTPSFGIVIKPIHDWDGDGVEDLLVVSNYVNDISVGAVHVILGGQAVGSLAAPGAPSFNLLGTSGVRITNYVDSADINGDGRSDIATTLGGVAEIRMYLSSGSLGDRTTASSDGRVTATGPYLNAIGGAGDFNGDNRDEVVYVETSSSGTQRVGAIRGQATTTDWSGTTDTRSLFSITAPGTFSLQGFAVGDLDADGLDEFATQNRKTGSGANSTVCVFRGDTLAGVWTTADADACIQDEHPYDQLGSYAASAGDINGDGVGDLMAVAQQWDNTEGERGAVYLFAGSTTAVLPERTSGYLALVAPANAADSPPRVADVDQDGLSDLFTTNYNYTIADPAMTWMFEGAHLAEGGVFLGPIDGDRSLSIYNPSVPLTRADGEVIVAVADSAALRSGAVFFFGDLAGSAP